LTDVSEELTASIVTVIFINHPDDGGSDIGLMETVGSSETSVNIYQTTRY
jgi:hypothetical protein